MNTQDDLERMLGNQLHRQADQMDGSPLGLGDVKSRAGRIQRNRRLAAGAGLAAAVAIIVPAAMFAGSGLNRADQGPGPATNAPSVSPTHAVEPTTPTNNAIPNTDGVPEVDLARGAPDGSAPSVAYVRGTTLFRGDGTEVALPEAYRSFAVVGEQYVGVRSDNQGNSLLDVMAADGEVTETLTVTEGFATNVDGSTIAWSTPEGGITTMWADGRVDLADQGAPVSPVAVVGGPDCHEAADGCTVFFNHQGEQPPEYTASHGLTDAVVPGPAIKLNDVLGERAAVQISYSDTGSCSGVYDSGAATYVWKTCDYALQSFSPDGSLILATDAYGDGLGFGYVTVLDAATGDPLVNYLVDRGFVSDLAWEDDGHALLTTYGAQGWNVYRVDDAGVADRALGPDSASQDDRPFTMTGSP